MAQGALPYANINDGTKSALDVTAASVIKAAPGRIAKITVIAAPTAGALTVNDAATLGAAATSNAILNTPYGNLTPGQVITLTWPCANGIVISSVGTGGAFSISYN